MTKQRLRLEPNEEIILKVLNVLGIKDYNDKHKFTKFDLIKQNSVKKMIDLLPELILYYYVCHLIDIFKNLNEKRLITIANHFLFSTEYIIESTHIVKNRKKIIMYNLNKKINILKNLKILKKNDEKITPKSNIFYVDFN